MRIHFLAAGTRRPTWEREGFETYAGRMPRECMLTLTEIPVEKRRNGVPVASLTAREGKRILRAVPGGSRVIALDEHGKSHTTRALSVALDGWLGDGRDVSLLIGGPDGLSPECKQAAESLWSLSPLTFPHGLVRIIVAEQLYRAWSLLKGHPYHRD